MWRRWQVRSARAAMAGALAVLAAGCSSESTGTAASSTDHPVSHSATAQAVGWLAYQGGDGSNDRVHLVHLDGTNDHTIAAALPGRTAHPDFTRDGRQLVFDQLTSQQDADQVYISDGDGKQPRLVAPCRPPTCLDHWEASWSPNGRQLAISTGAGPMTANGPARLGLAIVDVATQTVTPLLEHPGRDGQDHFARWSPDGSMLVFWRERGASDGSTETAVFRIDASGKGLRQLTPWALLAGDPDWSPDGSTILFSTRPLLVFGQQGQSELYLMNPDGTGRRQITHNGPDGPRATQPRWTPDGKSILYVRTTPTGLPRHIYTMRPDGTHDTAVLATRDIYTHPEMQPGT